MLHQKPLKRFFNLTRFSVIAISALIVGCAQTQPDDYYKPPAQGTLNDAQRHAMGKRGSRAPSQLQIGFGETEQDKRAAAQARAQAAAQAEMAESDSIVTALDADQALVTNRALAKPLIQARTFLGTLPCADSSICQANRITITFAPSGEWRARIQALGSGVANQPSFEQGCWNVTGQDPVRIAIQSLNNAITASFTFDNNNVMRLTNFNDAKPKLDYSLTRQAEIDPIEEISTVNKINCD